MSNKSSVFDTRTLLISFGVLIGGLIFAYWTVQLTEHSLRDNLLTQARMVANTLGNQRIQKLSGTEADLNDPTYLRLKATLASARQANKKCRFIYLMGQKPNLEVFFYADSEAIGSKDESPAGQIYTEISSGYLKTFEEQVSRVEGPVTDRWGSWVSALVPMHDAQTGDLVAVLGMDIDATSWKWMVMFAATLPMVLTFLLIAGGIFWIANERYRVSSSRELIQREAQYRLLADNMVDNIWVFNLAKMQLSYISPSVKDMFGYTPEESISLDLTEHISPEDLDRVMTTISEELEKENTSEVDFDRSSNIEIRQLCKDGSTIWTDVKASFIRDEDGKPTDILGITRDISDRKEMEFEREKYLKELQSAINEVKQLSGLIPICASCKKIRDDEGYWSSIEKYISSHSSAQFSHSLCPECAARIYPDIDLD